MQPKILNLFPLTIYQSKIEIPNFKKAEMIKEILEMKKRSENSNNPNNNGNDSWTGDTQGYEKLFTNKKFGLSFDKLKFYKKPKLLNKSYNIEEFFSYKKRLKYYKHFRANFDGKGSERIINFINKL